MKYKQQRSMMKALLPLSSTSHPSTVTWTRWDTHWVLSLFGTAVGAGILFLPINAGLGGFWPLLLLTLLTAPMTYLAHNNLCQLVLSSTRPGNTVTEVVTDYFGIRTGKILSFLYFFSIYPILLIYGVGITNTLESFLNKQLSICTIPRYWISITTLTLLIIIIQMGEQQILRVTRWTVYPLVLILAALSFYLIPCWNLTTLHQLPTLSEFGMTVWVTLPVLVFSFNHSPAISSFCLAQQRHYGQHAANKARWILRRTSITLLLFVMFFVFSCVLSLTPADLSSAKQQNISILSYLANQRSNTLLAYLGPIVALLAMISSFFGHYQGAYEGLVSLISPTAATVETQRKWPLVHHGITLFFLLSLWGAATINPNILKMIESFSGPIIALLLFILPIFASYKVPQFKMHHGRSSELFIMIMGIVSLSAIIYSLII